MYVFILSHIDNKYFSSITCTHESNQCIRNDYSLVAEIIVVIAIVIVIDKITASS